MIRYRTRDITALVPGACPCGRTLRRMRRIGRRSDDMLIIRGVNVFPSQIEAALLEVEGTLPHYQIILTREHGPGPDRGAGRGHARRSSATRSAPWKHCSDRLWRRHRARARHSHARSRLVEPHTIQRSEGKAKRVIDKREAIMKIQQLSLFLENKPGTSLAPAACWPSTASTSARCPLADTQHFGILRLIVSDGGKAAKLLEGAGYRGQGDRGAGRRGGGPSRAGWPRCSTALEGSPASTSSTCTPFPSGTRTRPC